MRKNFLQRSRRGITLLEVLFSIGIIVIGVLGTTALLSVAGLRAKQGLRARQAAALAEQAISEIEVRGWTRPDSIAVPVGSTYMTLQAVLSNPAANDATFRGQLPSVCFDPYFIAINTPNRGTVPTLATRFPYIDPRNPVSMPRVSASRRPGISVLPLTVAMAERITTDQNSLAFDLPSDETLGPTQNFGAGNVRRQTDGELSWIATLTPRFNRYQVLSDQFTLSVAVLQSRIPQLQIGGVLNQKTERLVEIRRFLGNGMGGGGIELMTRDTRSGDDLELRHNQWVLVSGLLPTSGAIATAIHAWYEVISVDEQPRLNVYGRNRWTRFITLQGPDWPVGGSTDVRVTIMDRVIAVREKTVRMKGYSLWE